MGGDNVGGGTEGRVFRNIYKGHMEKNQREVGLRVGGGDGWGGGRGGGEMETTVLEQ